MKVATLLVVLLGLTCGKLRQTPAPVTDIMDVVTGLIKGLELDTNSPGACANDLTSSEDDIQAVISDVTRIIGGDEMAIMQLLTDGESLISTLTGSNTDCKWSSLLTEFESLATEAGQKQILANVMANAGSLFADAKGLASCPTDLTGCGFQIGQIFRLVFNWGIQTPAPRVTLRQASGFLSGLLSGIETPGSNGACATDVNGVGSLVDTIVKEVESAVTGNVADAIEAFSNIKKLLNDVKNFNGDCNFTGLLSKIESLATPTGWMSIVSNVMSNLGAITSDATALENCTSNAQTCGYSIGEILRLTLGWGLGPTTLRQAAATTFFDSFLQGLQNNPNSPSECATDLTGLAALVSQIVADIQKVASDYTVVFQLISDAKTFVTDLDNYAAPCNVPDLISVLQSLTTPAGVTNVVNNFKMNIATIMMDAPALANCSADLTTCGLNAGTIVRLVLGWSI